ncbi:MAG: 3D domain-containing protein [Lachnospiraceae bacterium]|nr:3D domain-containing protein [Lachnospiraceae bacterium]
MFVKKATSLLLAASLLVFAEADPVYAGIGVKASDMDMVNYMAESGLDSGENNQESLLKRIETAEAELERRKRDADAAADAARAEAAEKAAAEAAAAAEAEAAAAEEVAREEMLANAEYLGTFTLTAYCNCASCCGTAGNATASGVMPTSGHTVAMGGIDFGTKLLINGTVYTVEDRGTPYGHVDIYMDSHDAALQFGMGSAEVYLINE